MTDNVYEGIQGARRQHTKDFEIRRFIADLLEEDPDLTVEEVIHALKDYTATELAKGNQSPLYALADYAGSNNFRSLQSKPPKPPTPAKPAERSEPLYSEAEVRAGAAKVVACILEKVVLPSGRTLYDSTREEIVQFNERLTGLIEKLKPGQTPRQAGITTM